MKLTYWIAEYRTNNDWNIRTRTKKQCLAERDSYRTGAYGEPRKVTIEYTSAFDLMIQATNKSGLDEKDYDF